MSALGSLPSIFTGLRGLRDRLAAFAFSQPQQKIHGI
jgi:hypothetical protein